MTLDALQSAAILVLAVAVLLHGRTHRADVRSLWDYAVWQIRQHKEVFPHNSAAECIAADCGTCAPKDERG